MSGYQTEPAVDLYPNRVCEVCGRKGGGNPSKGRANVVEGHAHQLCGDHWVAFYDYREQTEPERIARWVDAETKKAKGAA